MINNAIGYVESLPRGQQALLGVGLFAATFVASLVAVTAVLVWLPATYFREEYVSRLATRHPLVRWAGLTVKNILGAFLVVLGIVLSLPGIPGQGLLTILIGVMLLNFPGKRRIERRLISRPGVLAAVNALRARFGKPALVVD